MITLYNRTGYCNRCGKVIFYLKVGCPGNYNVAESFYTLAEDNLKRKRTDYGSFKSGLVTKYTCKCGNIIRHTEEYMPIKGSSGTPPLAYIPKTENWIGIKRFET